MFLVDFLGGNSMIVPRRLAEIVLVNGRSECVLSSRNSSGNLKIKHNHTD